MSDQPLPLDFVIIGAMKSGTTSLFDFLAAHPGVCAPRNKEPHYFTRGYKMSERSYIKIFADRTDGQLCGEASPTYSWVQRFPEAPGRIAADAPNAKVIFLIRDPLERALSQLRHQVLVGTAAASMDKAVANPEIWQRSSYRTAIEAYLTHFPRERLHVVDLADLGEPSTLRAVLDFLGLPTAPLEPLALPEANASASRAAVPGFVGRLASTPAGAVVRNLVSRDTLRRLKQPFERPVGEDGAFAITREDLQREVPEQCRAVEAEYRWVRENFLLA